MLVRLYPLAIILGSLVLSGCTSEVEIPPEIQRKSEELADPIIDAIEAADVDALNLALAKGADPRAQKDRELPPLHIAAMYGLVEIGELLIAHKADVNQLSNESSEIENGESRGRTPLHIAVMHNHVEFTSMLLEHRADVNAKNAYNMTPLDIAVSKGKMLTELSGKALGDEVEDVTSAVAANDAITNVLRANDAVTTEEIDAKRFEEKMKGIEGGGLLGQIEENLQKIRASRDQLPPLQFGPDDPEAPFDDKLDLPDLEGDLPLDDLGTDDDFDFKLDEDFDVDDSDPSLDDTEIDLDDTLDLPGLLDTDEK